MLALTSDIPTWAHRVPVGRKFAVLAGVTLVIAAARALPLQGVALAGAALLYLSCGTDFARAGLRTMRGIAIIGAIIGLWHLFMGAPATAALIVMRLLATVALANFVTMTTRLDEITGLFDRLLATIRVPATTRRRIALAIALTIRFIPVLTDKAARLTEAWRARSPRRLSLRIGLPLALIAIDDAEQVAEALRARGGA